MRVFSGASKSVIPLNPRYGAPIEINHSNVVAILEVASQFCVKPVVESCIEFLTKNVDIHCAIYFLELAIRYRVAEVAHKCEGML